MDWRSEVEAARQMVAIHETLGMPSAAHPHRAVVAMGAALETATRERDEARAEVERLRAAITRLRDNAAEMQSCARAVGHVEEREACAELADAIRDAAWTAGAEAMREAILDELPCVSAERDECAARMHRVAIPAPPCPEVSR